MPHIWPNFVNFRASDILLLADMILVFLVPKHQHSRQLLGHFRKSGCNFLREHLVNLSQTLRQILRRLFLTSNNFSASQVRRSRAGYFCSGNIWNISYTRAAVAALYLKGLSEMVSCFVSSYRKGCNRPGANTPFPVRRDETTHHL